MSAHEELLWCLDTAALLPSDPRHQSTLKRAAGAIRELEADNAAQLAKIRDLDDALELRTTAMFRLEADNAALRAERQYTCDAHKNEVRKGGACVWCEVAALFNERERAINAADHLRADIAALKAENAELKEIIGSRQLATQLLRTEAERDALLARLWANPKNFEEGPCFECGYRGHSYYQPNVHKCAAKYHAAIDAARKGKP